MYVKPVGLAAIKFMYTEWMNPDDPRASARYNLHAYNLIWGYRVFHCRSPVTTYVNFQKRSQKNRKYASNKIIRTAAGEIYIRLD